MRKTFASILFFLIIIGIGSSVDAVCVKTSEANLRNGPGTKYKVSWKVYKYMPFHKLDKKKVSKSFWYKVKDVDGDTHWIFGGLVTNKFKCATVKADKANVRTGPGGKYKKASLNFVVKYYSFRVVKQKGNWVNVIDEYDNKGWIHKNLLWIQ